MKKSSILEKLISVAANKEIADVLIRNARVVNVFTGEIFLTNVALVDEYIAGVGDCYQDGYKIIDASARYLIPGLIEAHLHIESSMLIPPHYAEIAITHGTTTCIADPHEITNVLGVEGFLFMQNISCKLPVDILYAVPSCIPATSLETTGSKFDLEDIKSTLDSFGFSVLGEMMNYPGVIQRVPEVLNRVKAALDYGVIIDGHCPGLRGSLLHSYCAAGISSDHESISWEEAKDKLRQGMHIIIREGSAARNLEDLIKLINEDSYNLLMFCRDDLHATDLIEEGEIDYILRKAVALGVEPIKAIRMATINPARYYRLWDRGAIAPGYKADLVLINNLRDFEVDLVIKNGVPVAENGKCIVPLDYEIEHHVLNTINLPEIKNKFNLQIPHGKKHARVIEVFPDQIVTNLCTVPVNSLTPENDIVKIAVVERHGKNGNIGLGWVKGFGLKKGAIASTVAHDSHNLILVGANDKDMEYAALELASKGGGMIAVANGNVLAALDLPVAGLMSLSRAKEVAKNYSELLEACKIMGCKLPDPFMTMSFLSLAVIPELKITDKGLVDVKDFKLVDVYL